MANEETLPSQTGSPSGFRISSGPVVPNGQDDHGLGLELGELPRVYGEPLLFAIARDPRTVFVYWNVDWSNIFAEGEPVDRQVYLRVQRSDGTSEAQLPVEPMLGSFYAPVAEPHDNYRVEIGYYDVGGAWNSVAHSESVTMPPEGASENLDVHLATLPFHLSFQRLVDLFRASHGDGLAMILSRLQSRALTPEERALLTPEEWEILKAMDHSVAELETARRGFASRSGEDLLRKRTEAILGFGATSPAGGFGGGESSWSQAGS